MNAAPYEVLSDHGAHPCDTEAEAVAYARTLEETAGILVYCGSTLVGEWTQWLGGFGVLSEMGADTE